MRHSVRRAIHESLMAISTEVVSPVVGHPGTFAGARCAHAPMPLPVAETEEAKMY